MDLPAGNISSALKCPKCSPGFDAVVCIGPHKVQMARLAIRSLQLFARPQAIYAITNSEFFPELRSLSGNGSPVNCIDENAFVETLSLNAIRKYLTGRTGTDRGAGWYFQQFLKMAAARMPNIASHFLIWDSDTIMLKPVEFFDPEGKVLINPKEENHRPYFELTEHLLGYGRMVHFSFISEHFMINSAHMREMLELIEERNPGAANWVYAILDHITTENFKQCGLSEFEMFGNFLQVYHPDSYRCRPVRSSRDGAALFGMSPNKFDLYSLAKGGYCFVSFERWNRLRGWRVLAAKARAAGRFWTDYCSSVVSNRNKTDLQIVASLFNDGKNCALWKPSVSQTE